jgi:hypothetical protein
MSGLAVMVSRIGGLPAGAVDAALAGVAVVTMVSERLATTPPPGARLPARRAWCSTATRTRPGVAQALEGRPTEAIFRPSPSSDRNLPTGSRRTDGALVTDCTERQMAGLRCGLAGEGREGMAKGAQP